jgi:hypothetical protein
VPFLFLDPPFFLEYSSIVHHPVNWDDRQLLAHVLASDFTALWQFSQREKLFVFFGYRSSSTPLMPPQNIEIKKKIPHPVGKDGEDELPGLKGLEDALDEVGVRLHGHVCFEAHVRELGLRGDVDRHVLTLQGGQKSLLKSFFFVKMKNITYLLMCSLVSVHLQ